MKRKVVSLLLTLALVLLFVVPLTELEVNASGTTLIIHYQRNDETYEGWNLWIWPDGGAGEAYAFDFEDSFGKVAVLNFPENIEKFGFIVRTDDWDKDVSEDRFIEVSDGFAEIWVYTENPEFTYEAPDEYIPFDVNNASGSTEQVINDEDTVNVRVHYRRYDDAYDGWNLWIWPDGKDGAAHPFNDKDDFGPYADLVIPNAQGVSQLGFIVRLNDWEAKDVEKDRYMQLAYMGDDNVLDIYLVQGDGRIYYNVNDIDLSAKFLNASLIEMNSVDISVNVPFELEGSSSTFSIVGDNGISIPIVDVTSSEEEPFVRTATVTLESPLLLGNKYMLTKEGYGEVNVKMNNVFSTQDFEDMFFYDGDDLGATYSKESTAFRLWAPTATWVSLLLYENGLKEGEPYSIINMEKDIKGTWITEVDGDLNNVYYTYKVEVDGEANESVDPYAKAVGVNGYKSMVIDLAATNPSGWDEDTRPAFENFTDAIIYELHVRDLSSADNSGIEHKGKFLGLTETGTTNDAGLSTGLDHIKELGITHLHILPAFDFRSIDETKLDENNFNWGYDPENYNVPEGSYSTDPYNGAVRVKEFKTMVQTLHQNDIRVVMDVVYNHTGATVDSNLNKVVPDYYYRTVNGAFSNGSGTGNETASERAMVRKMIVDSVVYWATEYRVDGFRFDLMALHDIETMNAVRAALDEVDPSIIIYGEGWTGGSSPLPDFKKALKQNTYMMEGIAAFSDDIRDGIKGHVFTDTAPGFVNGLAGMEESVKFGIVGATEHPQVNYSKVNYSEYPWANAPSQSINYVSAHDNLVLWDKLAITNPNDSVEERIKMDKLSNAIVLTSQGIPFLHAGVEMLRTKDGDHNSYKSPDDINQIDWNLKTENIDVFNYYTGLIDFREAHPALRMTTQEEIAENLTFFGIGDKYTDLQLPTENMIGYLINNNANGDTSGSICVLFNGNAEDQVVTIPEGTWDVFVNGEQAGTEIIDTINGSEVTVSGRSALVLSSSEVVNINQSSETTDTPTNTVDTELEDDPSNSITLLISLLVFGVAALIGFILYKRNRK